MTDSSNPPAARAVGWPTYLLGALGGGIRGYELGVVAGAMLFAGPALSLSAATVGWVVSSALLGSLVGALGVGPFADIFGRRLALTIGAILYLFGIVGAAIAPGAVVLIASRVVLGLGVGIATAMIPVYLSEIAPALRRGSFSALFQVLITIGVLTASLVSLALEPTKAWRWMFGLGAIPAVAMLLGSFRLPQSPRWLVRHGRDAEARAILSKTRGAAEADHEIEAIRAVNTRERRSGGARAILGSRRLVRLLVIGSVLGIFQQLIGINAITYYAPTVLTGLGFSNLAAILANVGLSTLGLITTLVMAFVVIDNLGRKRPLMYGALAMALSMTALAVSFLMTSGGAVSGPAGYVAVAGLALFQIAFGLSWGGIVWVVLSEMYPLAVRGAAMGIATFMTELTSVIVGLVFPTLLNTGAPTVFFGFTVMCLLAFVWATFMVPETKKESLEDLESRLTWSDSPTPEGIAPQ